MAEGESNTTLRKSEAKITQKVKGQRERLRVNQPKQKIQIFSERKGKDKENKKEKNNDEETMEGEGAAQR